MPSYHQILEQIEKPFPDYLAEREGRRQELKNWRSLLTEEQRHDLDFAGLYATCFGDYGLIDDSLLMLISRLRDLLDSAVSFLDIWRRNMPSGADIYRKSLRDAVRAYRTQSIDYDQFWEAMVATIQRRLPQAWYEGSQECGVAPADLSPEERMALQQAIVNEMSFITKLAQAIDEDRQKYPDRKTPTKGLFSRLDIWAQRYTDLQSRARLMACDDQKLKWILGPTKEHCPSCLKLGAPPKVKRATYWRRVNVYPQRPVNHSLDCEGYNCLCQLLPTDERCSPGPLPRLP